MNIEDDAAATDSVALEWRSGTDMKLTIERAALLRALGHVQSAVERRNTIPILSNVLL